MFLAERIDEFGKAGWIAAMVLGFWFFWPVGLAVLIFLSWSGRIHAWRCARRGRWYNMQGQEQPAGTWNSGPWGAQQPNPARWSPPWARGCGSRQPDAPPPSGNHAFDDYRTETLRRLEEEQREFVEYLERLRRAKDKAEFDQFMAERRPRPPAPEASA
jgi:hypothetical protein